MELLSWQIWFLIAALLFILEMLSGNFVLLFLGLACTGAAICAAFKLSFMYQCLTFCAISSLTIFLFLRQKRISSNKKGNDLKAANSERLIGLIGIVTEEIPEFGTGSVKVENETWMATSESGKQISLNETVTIKKISGVKLVVEIAKKD